MQTIKELVKRAVESNTDPWLAILDFRNAPSQGIDASPAQRLLGRRTRSTLMTHRDLLAPEWKSCAERQAKEKARQQEQYNIGARDLPPLKVGDQVVVQVAQNDHHWQQGVIII